MTTPWYDDKESVVQALAYLKGYGLAVHPNQAKELNELAEKHGVTEQDIAPMANAILKDRLRQEASNRKLLKSFERLRSEYARAHQVPNEINRPDLQAGETGKGKLD